MSYFWIPDVGSSWPLRNIRYQCVNHNLAHRFLPDCGLGFHQCLPLQFHCTGTLEDMCQCFLELLAPGAPVVNGSFHLMTPRHCGKQSKLQLKECKSLPWRHHLAFPWSCLPINRIKCFSILPPWSVGNVLGEFLAVAGLLNCRSNMGCNKFSCNFQGGNVTGWRCIHFVESVIALFTCPWWSSQLITVTI